MEDAEEKVDAEVPYDNSRYGDTPHDNYGDNSDDNDHDSSDHDNNACGDGELEVMAD
jgi:hypothetical protein